MLYGIDMLNVMNELRYQFNYLKTHGYDVIFLAHQGSFNYGLQYENSDVDSKAIILPSFEDFVSGKPPLSTTIELENGCQIDVKDIRLMFENLKKMNLSYIELLYTDYKIIDKKYADYIDELLSARDEISTLNKNQFLRCIAGMSKEKVKALCHPYPKTQDKIEKFGFDGKQLHHCIRLCEIINRYVKGEKLEDCYVSKLKNELINIKQNLNIDGDGYMPLETAKKLCEKFDSITYGIKEKNLTEKDMINQKGIDILDNIKYKILERKLKNGSGGSNG